MSGMYDVSCPKCRKKFGWGGHAIDRPPCPRCGHQVSVEERAALAREIEQAKEMMFARSPETESGKTEAVWLQDWHPIAIIYVGRADPRNPKFAIGIFGNPFSANPKSKAPVKVNTIDEAVSYYRRWLEGDLAVCVLLSANENARRCEILRRLPELRGKRLACWRHDGPCHAQVLAELADGPLGDPPPGKEIPR